MQRCAGTATPGPLASRRSPRCIAFAMYPHFELSNLVMVYLLGVTVAGLRLGRGPSALTAVLNVAAFDFFFVPPRYSFAVSDAQYLVTFAVDADHRTGHRHPDGERAPADPRRRRARAAHGAAVRHEPRAGRDARHRQHGARRRAPRGRGLPVPGRGAAAGCRRQAALSGGRAARELVARRGSGGRAVGGRPRAPAGLGTDTLPAAPGSVRAAGR